MITSQPPLTWLCIFFSLVLLVINNNLAKFEVLASPINDIGRDPKIQKSRSRDTFRSTIDHILHFLVNASRGLGTMRTYFVKFSFTHSGDGEGSQFARDI